MASEDLIRRAREDADKRDHALPAGKRPDPTGTLLRDLATALEEAEDAGCSDCAASCACRFPDSQQVVQGERVPLEECLYHATLRARLAEVEAERDAERARFQALCMASGPDGTCQHGNVNDEARDMLCLWCAQEDTLRRERDRARESHVAAEQRIAYLCEIEGPWYGNSDVAEAEQQNGWLQSILRTAQARIEEIDALKRERDEAHDYAFHILSAHSLDAPPPRNLGDAIGQLDCLLSRLPEAAREIAEAQAGAAGLRAALLTIDSSSAHLGVFSEWVGKYVRVALTHPTGSATLEAVHAYMRAADSQIGLASTRPTRRLQAARSALVELVGEPPNA